MKKVQVVLFALSLLAILSVCSAASPAYYQLQVSSSSYKPSTIYAGNEVSIAVSIYNKSTATARDINLELSPSHYFEPIIVSQSLDRLASKDTKTVSFRVKTGDDISAGTYNFSLEMGYDNEGTRVIDYETVVITVSEIYRVALSQLAVSHFYPHVGDEIEIAAYVTNTGSIEARNLTAELSLLGEDDFGMFIVLSDTLEEISSLAPGASEKVNFRLKPSEKIEPGVFSFQLDATCLDCDETSSEKFALHVYGRPELFISGIDYSIRGRDTKNLIQGDMFSFSVQLDNLGKEDVKKVNIEISTDEGIIGTKKSYVGSIDADDSSAGLFDLIVLTGAAEGPHNISIAITYLDELDQEQKLEDAFTLHISKMPEPSPLIPYVLVIIILAILYFLIKMIFRQLAIRKL